MIDTNSTLNYALFVKKEKDEISMYVSKKFGLMGLVAFILITIMYFIVAGVTWIHGEDDICREYVVTGVVSLILTILFGLYVLFS